MTLTNDGRYMIVGLADGFVKVFDFQTKQEIHTFNGGSLALSNKIFSVNTWGNRFIMAGYESGEILIFDLEKRELIHFQSAHGSAVTSIAATSDGSYLVSCSRDKSVKIFNLQVVKQELGTFFHEGICRGINFYKMIIRLCDGIGSNKRWTKYYLCRRR